MVRLQPIWDGLRLARWDLLLIVLFGYVAFFHRLGELPLTIFDEARVGVNALEMLRSGDLLTTTAGGAPDLWNTKPPLAIWLQVVCLHLFGVSEFALRAPSALAGLATALLVYAYAWRVSGERRAGLIAALVLMGCVGFVGIHVTRTAEYDALLVLFTTCAVFSVGLALAPKESLSPRWLVLAGSAFALAILTKGVAGLMVLPGLALFACAVGRFGALLKSPFTWIGGAIALGAPAAFYVMREMAGAGFFNAMVANELGSRFTGLIAGEQRPWFYYILHLVSAYPLTHVAPWPMTATAFPWSIAALPAAWLALRSKQASETTAILLCGVVAISFLAIISVARTRLTWYAAPIYPLIAVIVGLGLNRIPKTDRFRFAPPMVIALSTAMVFVAAARNWRTIDLASDLPDTRLQAWIKMAMLDPSAAHVRIVDDGTGKVYGRPNTGASDFYSQASQPRDVAVVGSDYKVRSGETLVWCGALLSRTVTVEGKLLASYQDCRKVRAR